MLGPITYLDAAVLAVCFISGLLAMYRGFAREMLSIVSWAVAAAAVLYFVIFHKPFAQDMAAQMGTQVAVAQIVVGAVIFLIVLIVVHLITARLSDAILDSRVGMIDRILGFLFGVVRGFVLIVIPYMFYEAFFPDPNTHLPWVREAKTLPYIKGTGDSIRYMLEAYMPSSLTAPPGEQPQEEQPAQPQQQGALENPRSDELALEAPMRYHISVTWQVRAS
ncbi:MAG: CvpA family protein [Hyphomicrobium sp.]|uniref:CvpA family protein n=1 Tax=Hyphomicrobium sp. TaxID=82 RepID=UPI0013294058|nr:CvpA family protein [Hyphomicrobium sp.]KAB2942757.1 MAG: CvpA family protein [Hyphomicrobium sp.]MBZ0211994.1 CvpA family protein [Hyphomicrobium sp.]MCZ7593632.1 CvpA family protein [Hyphomicrobium sp.]